MASELSPAWRGAAPRVGVDHPDGRGGGVGLTLAGYAGWVRMGIGHTQAGHIRSGMGWGRVGEGGASVYFCFVIFQILLNFSFF